MPRLRNRAHSRTRRETAAFLNVPYDDSFRDLFLAYVAGLTAFGLTPRATLEIPGGERRLERIVQLIADCRYSFHDLSRVELDTRRPPTPRFNMPFELGLTVSWERFSPEPHTWFVLEIRNRRVAKSLSDLAGTDVYIHDGKPYGVFRELGNALVRADAQPSAETFKFLYRALRRNVPDLLGRIGARSLFEARALKELVVAARALAARRVA